MADLLAGYSANYVEVPPHSREGEEEEEEDEEVFNSRMQESMALNAQLKAMLAQAEASEQQRLQQPQMRLPMGARQAQPPRTAAGLLVPRPKIGGWGGSTHSEARAAEITRANQILVSKRGAIGYLSGQRIAAFLICPETSRRDARVDWALYCDDTRGTSPTIGAAMVDAMAAWVRATGRLAA